VLGQVVGQLGEKGVLVGGELLPVGRRQVEDVLVRDVDARDRDRLVVVHLLGELAGQLDRLHVRPKGTAEDALDEGFDPVFDATENVHGATEW
jgi:hypothetical protein